MNSFAQVGPRVVALVLVALPLVWLIVSYRDAQLRLAEEMKSSVDAPVPRNFRVRETMMTELRSGNVPAPRMDDVNIVAKRAR